MAIESYSTKASDYVALKTRIKSEVKRRKHVGSVESFGGVEYDFIDVPKAGSAIKTEHYDKLSIPLKAINKDGLPASPMEIGDEVPDIAIIDAKLVTLESKGLALADGGCSGSCTGLCSTSCTGTCHSSCTSCTGCSGSCTGTCSGGCSSCSGCAGSCTSCSGCTGCGGTCSWNCSGSCSLECSGCSGSCTSCSGCSGSCISHCAGNCAWYCASYVASRNVVGKIKNMEVTKNGR